MGISTQRRWHETCWQTVSSTFLSEIGAFVNADSNRTSFIRCTPSCFSSSWNTPPKTICLSSSYLSNTGKLVGGMQTPHSRLGSGLFNMPKEISAMRARHWSSCSPVWCRTADKFVLRFWYVLIWLRGSSSDIRSLDKACWCAFRRLWVWRKVGRAFTAALLSRSFFDVV